MAASSEEVQKDRAAIGIERDQHTRKANLDERHGVNGPASKGRRGRQTRNSIGVREPSSRSKPMERLPL